MKENKGNYPAFPNQGFITPNGQIEFGWSGYGMGGLSARDYMAIEAMKVYMNYCASMKLDKMPSYAEVSKEAYMIADAMLEQSCK